MKTKLEIAKNWLPRYTGTPIRKFSKYVLLVNFMQYLEVFAEMYDTEIQGANSPMQSVHADGVTLINFGMGSPMAATVMDLLIAIKPEAVLFLGKCGGLKRKNKLGDFILPLAAIRGEGTSDEYMSPDIPALPSFALQRAISSAIVDHNLDYYTGTCFTTNRRLWEHDEEFKEKLRDTRAMAIDMETATIFSVGFVNEIPRGALLLVTDNPMTPEGVKTAKGDKKVSKKFLRLHLSLGVAALKDIKGSGESVKHLRFIDKYN